MAIESSIAVRWLGGRLPPLPSICPLQLVVDLSFVPRHYCSSPVFSRRRNSTHSPITSPKFKTNKKQIKKKPPSENRAKDNDLDDDAFEALFSQLEEDLKNDGVLLDDFDGEISAKDLAQLELELAEALGDDGMLGISDSLPDHENTNDVEENAEDDDEEEEEEDLSNLKTWQLRRLAYALKDGKRKTSTAIGGCVTYFHKNIA